jgi:alkylhydroperoxidase family enzyme
MNGSASASAETARIPYAVECIPGADELIASIKARRGGRLLKIDRLLLHSPSFASGWNALLGNVINNLSLSPKLSQLLMCAVGEINKADYELFSHRGSFLAAGGSQGQLDALADVREAARRTDLFDETERASLQVLLEMTRDVAVSASSFEALRQVLKDDKTLVEIIGTIAAYNMVSRFVVALDLKVDDEGL